MYVLASIHPMKGVFNISAVRTAIGKYGGALRDFSAADLGVVATRAALGRAGAASLRFVSQAVWGWRSSSEASRILQSV